MEFVRSCIFPHQTLIRKPVSFHGAAVDAQECHCAVLDRVNEAIQIFMKKRSVTEMTQDELKFLPYELLKRNAKKEIHLVWDNLSEHARKNLGDHKICERHPQNEGIDSNAPPTLIVDCWYCRAEKESEEAKAEEDSQKY